tara:strand:+ start:415 stop:750 length:336 start_codon:yes stop_codon:yes gene_type:complete
VKQQFTKTIQNSEGETTHFAKVQNRKYTVHGEDFQSYSIKLAEDIVDQDDWHNNSYINVRGTNKQGDIKISATQEIAITEGEQNYNYRILADMVITREDAKSLIKTLTHLL